MKLSRFLFGLITVTLFALVFVQLQVEIVRFAYACKERENIYDKLLDDRELLRYNIYTFESADNVGRFLEGAHEHLRFAEKGQLAELRLPVYSAHDLSLQAAASGGRGQSFFARVFSLKSQAEATEKLNR